MLDQDEARDILKTYNEFLKHCCEHGVKDADEYETSCYCLHMIRVIDIENMMIAEKFLMAQLLDTMSEYEEEHYPYGN